MRFWIFQKYHERRCSYKTKWIDDIPKKMKKRVIYILGGRKHSFQVIMRCPRSCKKNIYLNISDQHKKRWYVTEHNDGTVSIRPSIWVQDKCNCHYWIKEGRVFWCELPGQKIA